MFPASPWNYALDINVNTPDKGIIFTKHPIGNSVLTPDNAPVSAEVKGRRLPEWVSENGSVGPVPEGPIKSDKPVHKLILITYGRTNLRITEFPFFDKDSNIQ